MSNLLGSNLIKGVFDLGALRSVATPFWSPVRFASKKSTGGNRNKSQAKGKHTGIKRHDGQFVFAGDRLVSRQMRLGFHPGQMCQWRGYICT